MAAFCTSMSCQTSLPAELATLILSSFSLPQLEVVRQVCKEWHAIANGIILERLYGAERASSIPDGSNFFLTQKESYVCQFSSKKPKKWSILSKKSAFSIKKVINPLILSLKLEKVRMTGADFIKFAVAHPNLQVLSLIDCPKITYLHVTRAFAYFKNLRLVTLNGKDMFNDTLLMKLYDNPYLKRLQISAPSVENPVATQAAKALTNRKVTVILDQ